MTLLLLALAAAPGCKKNPPDASPSETSSGCALNTPCMLSDELTVTVTSINDSRCPTNAQCMWAGDAAVVVEAGGASVTLHSNPELGADRADLSGTTILLEDVTPYPGLAAPAPGTQRVMLRIGQQ
jgi:hypothetical protein